MGEIKDIAAEVYRPFVTDGVPASGANKPSKSEIANLFGLIEQRIGGAVAGLKFYPTRALLDADATQAPGTLAYVYDDATPANNGVYHYETGGWVVDTAYAEGVASVVQPIIDAALAQLAGVAPIKQFPNNSFMDGGVGRFALQPSPPIVATTDAVFKAAGALFEATIAPGVNTYWQAQFGVKPILPGEYVPVSVFVRLADGTASWPAGTFRVTLDPVAAVTLIDKFDVIDATHRRYHAVIRNTTNASIDTSFIQLENTGSGVLATTLYAHGHSHYPVTDVDWADLDPFDTMAQNDKLATHTAQIAALISGGTVDRVDIDIAAFGDSHTEGRMQVAAASDGSVSVINVQALPSPLDFTWNGTDRDDYARMDSAINSVTTPNQSTDQGFTAVSVGNGSWLGLLPSALRAAYPQIGQITTANLAAGGSSAYTWAGELASAYVGAFALPLDGDTITIAGRAYVFKTTPVAAYQVQIAGTPNGCIANLENAVNAEGSGFFASGTAANVNAWGATPGSTQFGRFNALQTGTAGNSLTITSSTPTRISAVNASNVAVSSVNFAGGSGTSALYQNAKSRLAGFAPKTLTITLGTNDANRPGYRGRKTQVELTKFVGDLRADFPDAKIIINRAPVLGTGATATLALDSVVLPAIDAVVAANSAVMSSVDMNAVGAGTGYARMLNTSDGIHLTPYGYSVLMQLFAREIADVLGFTA